jgi:hypothetical protein
LEELVLDEPLDVFAAVDGSPVGPGAVDEVEEGYIWYSEEKREIWLAMI